MLQTTQSSAVPYIYHVSISLLTQKSVTCGGNLDIPDDDSFVGYFTSPGYGQSQYPHNADCAWVITAPTNARVQLDFPAFDLEAHPR